MFECAKIYIIRLFLSCRIIIKPVKYAIQTTYALNLNTAINKALHLMPPQRNPNLLCMR